MDAQTRENIMSRKRGSKKAARARIERTAGRAQKKKKKK
jgi:hypothetical protein